LLSSLPSFYLQEQQTGWAQGEDLIFDLEFTSFSFYFPNRWSLAKVFLGGCLLSLVLRHQRGLADPSLAQLQGKDALGLSSQCSNKHGCEALVQSSILNPKIGPLCPAPPAVQAAQPQILSTQVGTHLNDVQLLHAGGHCELRATLAVRTICNTEAVL
jgi:hypothetical protein